jgi:UDP-N-acetylmuramoylalanine--D-glutamate ligase
MSFDRLGEKIAERAKAAILLGAAKEKISEAIAAHSKRTRLETTEIIEEAVELAANIAVEGDIVLLSPACASYDMFDNFQQRGEEFAAAVRKVGALL